MIYLQLTGGLGNQLFQYAFARTLQIQTGEELAINTYGFRFDSQREYSLSVFALSSRVIVLDDKEGKKQWKCAQLLNRVLFALNMSNGADNFYKLTKLGLYFTFDIFRHYRYALPKAKDKYIFGTFQTEQYFCHIRKLILKDFQVKLPLRKNLRGLIEEVRSCESVSVHVRRGDYVTNEKDKDILNICTEQYYIQAMEWISQQVKNPVFYIFSNTHEDIEWIKENYSLLQDNIKYVDMDNQDYEELMLMAACRHFVIANSTYSWWAQYLGEYTDKKVTAPSRWFEGGQDASDIYMSTWKIIEV